MFHFIKSHPELVLNVEQIMWKFPRKIFIAIPVLTARPSSVTDNLRGRYQTISGYDILV